MTAPHSPSPFALAAMQRDAVAMCDALISDLDARRVSMVNRDADRETDQHARTVKPRPGIRTV